MEESKFPKVHYVAFSFTGTNQFLIASTTDPRKPEKMKMLSVPSRFATNDSQVKYRWEKLDEITGQGAMAVKKLFETLRIRGWYVDPDRMEAFSKRFNL